MDLEWIKFCVRDGRYVLSHHTDRERQEDNLSIAQVEQALLSGTMVEDYADTGRGESCLMVGFSNDGTPIHIVCGIRRDRPVIVTVYIPMPPKFLSPYQRG